MPLDDVTPNAIHRNQILHFPLSNWFKVFGSSERVRLEYIVNVMFSSAMSELVVWKDNVRFVVGSFKNNLSYLLANPMGILGGAKAIGGRINQTTV